MPYSAYNMKDFNIWTVWCELVSVKKQIPSNPARFQVQTGLMTYSE